MKKQDLLIIKLQEQIKKQMSISQSSYTSAWLDIKQKNVPIKIAFKIIDWL